MLILQFPQFAQLPGDLQIVILDYTCDRRDPQGINVPDRKDRIENKQTSLYHWRNLRLVCRDWSLWFSINAIRFCEGNLEKLAGDQMLERMTGLVDLEIFNPYCAKTEPEALRRIASKIPSSVRHLNECPIGMVKYFPRKLSGSLQTISIICDASEPHLLQSLKSLFRKFEDRVKHLHIYGISLTQEEAGDWEYALTDYPLQKLTLEAGKDFELKFEIPATLKRLKLIRYSWISCDRLSPACDSLEVLDAPDALLLPFDHTPIFSALKEMRIERVHPDELEGGLDGISSVFWPNLKKLYINSIRGNYIPQSLRFLSIDHRREAEESDDEEEESDDEEDEEDEEEGYFDLSNLPPLLEEFKYVKYNDYGGIKGQPPQEMKHLRRLEMLNSDFNLPKGVFNFFPALEELVVSYRRVKSIKWEDLLPVRHTLIDLNLQVCSNNSPRDYLFQFSRLKRVHLTCTGGELCTIDRLPRSLEKLNLKGNFIKGDLPLETLSKLRIFKIETKSSQFPISLFHSAPNLKTAGVGLDDPGMPGDMEELLEGLQGMTFNNLYLLDIRANAKYPGNALRFLEIFPNVRTFYCAPGETEKKTFDVAPKLLSVLRNNPSLGKRLKKVVIRINPYWYKYSRKHSSNESEEEDSEEEPKDENASEELKKMGISVYGRFG